MSTEPEHETRIARLENTMAILIGILSRELGEASTKTLIAELHGFNLEKSQ